MSIGCGKDKRHLSSWPDQYLDRRILTEYQLADCYDTRALFEVSRHTRITAQGSQVGALELPKTQTLGAGNLLLIPFPPSSLRA